MRRILWKFSLIAGAPSLLFVPIAGASVGIIFTNNTATPTSASVAPGASFSFSDKLTESSASDQVSGTDYQIHASANSVFEFLGRNSQIAGSKFTAPSGAADGALTPIILNPNNGTDLGTSTSDLSSVSGPGTYELADFSFEVLPGTPAGIYTLSFASSDYAGPAPGFATGAFDTLGTYTVAVPEPASMTLVGAFTSLLLRRRKDSDS